MSRRLLIVPMASVFAGLLAGKSDGSPSRNDTHGGSSRMHAGLPPSNATVAPPLLLFASASDLREKWGLIQHYGNVVQPAPASVGALGFPVPTSQCAFTGAKVLYLARTGGPDVDAGPIEMFWVCKTCMHAKSRRPPCPAVRNVISVIAYAAEAHQLRMLS